MASDSGGGDSGGGDGRRGCRGRSRASRRGGLSGSRSGDSGGGGGMCRVTCAARVAPAAQVTFTRVTTRLHVPVRPQVSGNLPRTAFPDASKSDVNEAFPRFSPRPPRPPPRSLRLPASRWGRADRRTGRVEAPVPATRPRARHPPVAPPPRRHRRHRRCRRRASTRYQRKLSSRPALRPLPPPHTRRPPRRLSPPLAATAGRHPPPPPSRQVGRRRRRRYRPPPAAVVPNHLTPFHIAARALHWCM